MYLQPSTIQQPVHSPPPSHQIVESHVRPIEGIQSHIHQINVVERLHHQGYQSHSPPPTQSNLFRHTMPAQHKIIVNEAQSHTFNKPQSAGYQQENLQQLRRQ